MIRIEKITIEEFRGIRSLTLDLNGESYAIAGPNGTGKSGVVDAIEFVLTGNISRLSGEGRGDLSVLKHGPHVDSARAPEKAQVTLEVSIPSLKKRVSLKRNVKNSKSLTISPEDSEVSEIIKGFERHPEFVLSRREIIKYVLAEPGKRASEVQALLQLNELEDARKSLLKISNSSEKELKPLEQQKEGFESAFMRAIGIDEITRTKILAAVNEKRKILGLSDLPQLSGNTSLKDGLDSLPATTSSRVPKTQAKLDVDAATLSIGVLVNLKTSDEISAAIAALADLQKSEGDLRALEKESLLNIALKFFDEHVCPVCEVEWKPEHFREVVTKQLQKLSSVSKAREVVENLLVPIKKKIGNTVSAINLVNAYVPLFNPPYISVNLKEYLEKSKNTLETLNAFLPLDKTIAALKVSESDLKPILSSLNDMGRLITSIPDPTNRDLARDYLVSGDERWKSYRTFAVQLTAAKKTAEVAKQVYNIFTKSIDESLEGIYKQVEGEFKSFYRSINDDEPAFEAKLLPSIGKLSFGVDFYGRGSFPPGAYHSEGHQDGMGLCLYLALMKHILGSGFSLAVLDDVLMSVDSGHRREVCKLLKTEFPNTQFILTTHDPVWLRHMKTVGLIKPKAGIEFQSWDVNKGPTQWKDIDVWAEISAYVEKSDIRGAAALLRYYMEYLSAEYCSELKGKVEYRGDNRYDLGKLLPGAAQAMRGLLKDAKASATSWGNTELLEKVTNLESVFSVAAQHVLDSEWQFLNPAIHFNELENLSKADFKPVVEAFKALSECFMCDKCHGIMYVTERDLKKDTVRCSCQAINLNLLKKK